MPKTESDRVSLASPRQKHELCLSASELTFNATALVWSSVVAALGLIGWTITALTPPLAAQPEITALFVPWARGSVAPEPDERRLYLVLTLLAPLLMLAAWMAVRRSLPARNVAGAARPWQGSTAWTLAGAMPFFAFTGCAAYLWATAPVLASVLQQPARYIAPLLAGTLAAWWVSTWRRRQRPKTIWRNIFLVAALPLTVAGGLAYRVFDYHTAALVNPVNIDVVFYPITQVSNGQHILVDFVAQYGCYAEILKPWFAVIGLSIARITWTLAGLQCIALIAICFTLSRLLRTRWLLFLGLPALIWLEDTWRQVAWNAFDPVFQYWPIRVLFPALSLVVAWSYLRRPTTGRAVAAGLLGGIATWWNVDAGAVTLLSLLGLFGAKALSERRLQPPALRWRTARHLVFAGGAAALALIGFYLILCLDARQWVDLGVALRTQRIFYISGFSMMRMPSALHLWHLIIGVYLLGLAGGLGDVLAGRPLSVGKGMQLYLSVLGIGLFSYFQGRSHDHVLLACLWPALPLALLLCDRQMAAVRYGLLPRTSAVGALPALALLAACVLSISLSLGVIVKANRAQEQLSRTRPNMTPIPAEVAFLKRTVPLGETCSIISQYQAIYYAATGLRSAFTGQSLFECLLQTDLPPYFEQVRARRARHVFTEHVIFPESNDSPMGPDFAPALYDAYRVAGRSPDGFMLHWEARSDPEMADAPPGRLARDFVSRSRLGSSPPAPRHALRCPDANVLLDTTGNCVSSPYDWGTVALGSRWAIEAVFTPAPDQPNYACLISNHPGTGHDGFTVQRPQDGAPGLFVCSFGNGQSYTASTPLLFEPGREHYLAISCEANLVTVFLDGAPPQRIPLTTPVTASPNPVTVGDWIGGERAFAGEITEVKIHSQPLTSEMVARNEERLRAGAE